MKKLILVYVVLAFILLTSCAVTAPPKEGSDEVKGNIDRKYSNIEELFLYWEEYGYPDYVGGVYSPGGSMSCLTVLLVGDDGSAENLIRDCLTDTYGLSFGTSEYSYNELSEVNEKIADYMLTHDKIYSAGIGWGSSGGYGADGKEFRVVVTVDESVLTEYNNKLRRQYGDVVEVEAGDPPILL